MHLCYVDEAGDSSLITSATSTDQPLMVIGALFIDADRVKPLTEEFLGIKRKYFPGVFSSIRHDLDTLTVEIKGCDVRDVIKWNRSGSGVVQHRYRFLDSVFSLVAKYDVRLVGRIWVKGIGRPLVDKSIYTITTQGIAQRFQSYLESVDSEGMIIADFRDTKRNSYVSHSVFTQKHKKAKGGDAYPRINETTTFGISNNHACLQIADIMCSTIIYPSASRVYCHPHISNTHTHIGFDKIRHRYKHRLRNLQFHYFDKGKTFRGLTVEDAHRHRTARELFL